MKVSLLTSPMTFQDLPPNSIALDGAVRGCHLDYSNNRWSFDHHAGNQHSISTRSTALQTLLALRAGLDMSYIENLYVSSIDADSVTATGLCLNRSLAKNEDVIKYITMYLDTVDSMGPCGVLQNEIMSFNFSLKAGFKEELTKQLLLEKVQLFYSMVEENKLFEAGEQRRNPCTLVAIDNHGNILNIEEGEFAFTDLYKSSNVGILYSKNKVTIGIKSSFVSDKHMLNDGLFDRLNEAEIAAGAETNEDGTIKNGWGGKDLVGGSPFKGETLLSAGQVTTILTNFIKE